MCNLHVVYKFPKMTEEEKEKELVKIAEESSLCGGDERSDKETVEPRFECPICISWLKDPVLTSCGHRFCSDCINTWLKKRGSSCPVDSKHLNPDVDLFKDLFTKREIAQQRTHCLYREYGCHIEISPIDLENHLNECSYKKHAIESQENCPFKDIGCREIFKSTDTLKHHLEEGMNSHMTMIATSLSHLTLKSNIDAKAAEAKYWDPPSKEETESQPIIHELCEKVVMLEQKNRELTFALENLQSSIIERTCNGSYIWKLELFHEKLNNMMENRMNMFFSPSFYTSTMGYKVCARINVSHNNSDFLSLVLHLVKSENDDTLDWPFEGWISFLLVNPDDTRKNILETAKTQSNLEAFKKPIYNINRRSYGFTEFILIKYLESFVKNDTVIIRIDVKTVNRLDKEICGDSLLTEETFQIHTEV
ncbi:TNF receptor-associated factor 6 isoform X3 [Leptopilina boulardi]|uniref:TNF receptor-associated factor 6 isoform X3 n=1 Tax=Leptopilina boulardi TaxID=63433 RepID=UPI0021F628CD|nr:TNF receptor-associated factor 6 isoform X3 [Leptopilina boulardi]